MEGFQFAHMEVWSVRGTSNAGPEAGINAKRKNGQRAWTVEEIIAELERLAAASTHVIPGRPGPEILPGTVGSFADLRAAHAQAVAIKEKFPYRQKDGSTTFRERKLRVDAPSLYASVVSLPVKTEAALADPEVRAECMNVLRAAMAHERKRITGLGGQLMCGVVHWDEEHVHIHLIALDPVKGRVDHLHPGRTAKKVFHEEHKDSQEDRDALRKKGNLAYCEAMRGWQDGFYDEVFDRAGLLRYGPGRTRMSRQDWAAYKAGKGQQAKDLVQITGLRHEAAALTTMNTDLKVANAAMERSQANEDARRRQVDARARDLEVQASDIIEQRQQVDQEKHRATTAKAAAERLKADAEARMTAIEVGAAAVLDRVIDYRPATDEKPEGLKFGPNRPETDAARKSLAERIQPAYAFLTGLAKTVSRLWTRQAKQERQAAELRRQAQVLRDAEAKALRQPEPALARLADGQQAGFTEEDFPDAWALGERTPVKQVASRLQGMRNLDLRACHKATSDAALLCEDSPVLRGDFQRAVAVLEHTAKARGFDLESGRHDPAKATDPAEARRYADQLPEAIKVKAADRTRQRVRR